MMSILLSMNVVRRLSVIAVLLTACGSAPVTVASSSSVPIDEETAEQATAETGEKLLCEEIERTLDLLVAGDLDETAGNLLVGNPVVDLLPMDISDPFEAADPVDWIARVDGYTADECGTPFLSWHIHTLFTCGSVADFDLATTSSWGPCADPRVEAVDLATSNDQLLALDELGRLVEEDFESLSTNPDFVDVTSALEGDS